MPGTMPRLDIIFIPFLGVLVYIIMNGDSMGARAVGHGGYPSRDTGEQLANLSSMHSAGKLTDAEFEQAKARVFAS